MSNHELAIMALGAALDGERVAFFEDSLHDSAEAFRLVEAIVPASCKVRRATGDQSVSANSGGSVHFFSLRSKGYRGHSLDRVYIPAEILTDEIAEEVQPCLAVSRTAQIIGYL